jgi:polyisoprenoid-binding protein YceI
MTTQEPANTGGERRIGLVLAILVLVGVLAVVGYGFWYLFLQPAGPAAVGSEPLAPIPSSAVSVAPLASGGTDGTWNVDTSIGSFSDASGTFVGYRVQEQLASIGANTAVGRTPQVTGLMTLQGTEVTTATITADLTALQSNDNRRDGQLSHQGIETSSFPTATFTLTSPIDLGSIPADGTQVKVTVRGQLTLHGVTKDVEIPMTAQISGDVIEVAGSLPIAFSDYGIQAPTSFAVLSVDDHGTMEFQVFFIHA